MTKIAIIAAAILAVTPAMAAQSIVGAWAPDPATCTPAAGMVAIGPKAMVADELSCAFADVSRTGDVVTWHGTCNDGASRKPATVKAALKGGTLSVTVHGEDWGRYRRCR